MTVDEIWNTVNNPQKVSCNIQKSRTEAIVKNLKEEGGPERKDGKRGGRWIIR
ncbi:MAG: hypothetical protein LBU30_03305 [Candidatus Methanoplasma sp.]|nr:hypothetical protein [Candidatus Methanoplasma sp.]